MSSNERPPEPSAGEGRDEVSETPSVRLIRVHEQQRPEDYDGTCLRPLGLCELGGCCDVCWYRPDHPRFKKKPPASGDQD